MGGDFTYYNEQAEEKRANILVVIQGYETYAEGYEEYESYLSYLSKEGTKYGIYFVLSSTSSNGVRYRLVQNFPNLYVLQLNDPADYAMILGGVKGMVPAKVKGRGLFKKEKALEFQTAEVAAAGSLAEYLRAYGAELKKRYGSRHAPRVPVLPECVSLDFISDYLQTDNRLVYPVGIAKHSLKPVYYDFGSRFLHLISYQAATCNFVESLARLLAVSGNAEVIVLNGGMEFEDEAHEGYTYYKGKEQLQTGFMSVYEEVLTRNNEAKDALEAGKERPEYKLMFCILHEFSALAGQLDKDAEQKLHTTLERCENIWNCRFILSDSIQNISRNSMNGWYKKQISQSQGIWLGDGFADQFEMKATRITREMREELEDDFGFVLYKGRPQLVKFLSETEEALYE